MGLDVIAISRAQRVDDDDENYISVYNANGIDRMDGKEEGRYTGAEEYHFRAGSYSGYNRWREWLSLTFVGVQPDAIWNDPDKYKNKPFVELINFGDNEGAFGPVTSAKLAKDFQEHLDAIPLATDEWDREKYADWQISFELASNDGFVVLT